jgi:ribosomal protein S15P/S13E
MVDTCLYFTPKGEMAMTKKCDDGTIVEIKLMGNLEIAYELLKESRESFPKDISYNEVYKEMTEALELPPRNVAQVLNLAEQLLEIEHHEEEKEKDNSSRLTVFEGTHGYRMIRIDGSDETVGKFVLLCEYLKANNGFPLCKKDDQTYEFLTDDLSYVKTLGIEIAKHLEYPIIFE